MRCISAMMLTTSAAAFGQPDKIRTLSSGSSMLEYRASRGLDLLVRGERQLVVEMHFDQRFDGRTTGGIGIGDSMDQVLRVSGVLQRLSKPHPRIHAGATWQRPRAVQGDG